MPLRDMDREQMWLLPPSLDELLPLDHPARFVAVFVDALDKEGWAELGVEIDGDPLGAPAYHTRALLCVWLYGFMTGVRSCRKLEAACRDQIPYLWLTGWQHPDHNTLWRFYKEHRQAMRRLFKRTVRTAVAMQLVDLAGYMDSCGPFHPPAEVRGGEVDHSVSAEGGSSHHGPVWLLPYHHIVCVAPQPVRDAKQNIGLLRSGPPLLF